MRSCGEALFEALGDAHDPQVLAEAQRLTEELFAGKKADDPNIIDAAVALTAVKGDAAMYDRLLNVVRVTKDPDFRDAALRALTWFESPELVERTLEFAVSDDVRSQDSWGLIALMLERRETQEQAWKFVREHWSEIERKATAAPARTLWRRRALSVRWRSATRWRVFRSAQGGVRRADAGQGAGTDRRLHPAPAGAAQEPNLQQWLAAHSNF